MSIDAMKTALEALEFFADEWGFTHKSTLPVRQNAIAALRAAIEQAEKQEPVAHLWQHSETGRTRVVMPDQIVTADATWFVVGPLYLAPPQRKPESLCICELTCVCGAVWRGEELVSAPPQRQPLTRKDVLAIIDSEPAYMITGLPMFYRDQVAIIVRKVERAHGIAAAKEKS